MAEKELSRTIAGRPFRFSAPRVVRALRGVTPEPVHSHYVVVGRRRYPPKQVISELTGLDRADFTSHQARRTLMRLGFVVGRAGSAVRRQAGKPPETAPPLVERLRQHTGEWVALRDDELLHASESPRMLVQWLSEHGQQADTMFRVPEDAVASSGLAPL